MEGRRCSRAAAAELDDGVSVDLASVRARPCVERGEVEAYTTTPAAAAAAFTGSLRAYESVRDDETGDVLYPGLVAAAHRLHSDPVGAAHRLIESLHDNLVPTPFLKP